MLGEYFLLTLHLQVKDVLLDHPLSPHGTLPVMCIDEAQVVTLSSIRGKVRMLQVLDPTLGWGTFRQDYGSATWAWLSAATGARLQRHIETDTHITDMAQVAFNEWIYVGEHPC